MELPKEFERVSWFGRGPGENYPDTQGACAVGQYDASVRDLMTPYVYPQENGNCGDVRRARFFGSSPQGLLISGSELFIFSAYFYTEADLDAAMHHHEMVERDFITLNIDHRHCGVGTGSCGPSTFDQYLVRLEPFGFRLEFSAS